MLPIILASASSSRVDLLRRIKVIPDQIIPADINEDPIKGESPKQLSERRASSKADEVAARITEGYLIAGDTVACVGRNMLPKAINDDLVRYCIGKIAGRRSSIYSSVCVVKKQAGQIIKKLSTVCTFLRFKSLTEDEIEYYVQSQEGLGKAGGYYVEGIAGSFLEFINGSYSNIVGLPLFETRNMLLSVGFKF